MVPGGLLVMSRTTRLISRTSLVMRVEIRSSSYPSMTELRRVRHADEVAELVATIRDRERVDPVVLVTTRNREADPLVDAMHLAAEIAPVPVDLIPTGPLDRRSYG